MDREQGPQARQGFEAPAIHILIVVCAEECKVVALIALLFIVFFFEEITSSTFSPHLHLLLYKSLPPSPPSLALPNPNSLLVLPASRPG